MAVKEHGTALQYVPYQLRTSEICLEAVKGYASALEYVPEALKTKDLCLTALKKDSSSWVMRYVPEHIITDDFCLDLLESADRFSSFNQIAISKSLTEDAWRTKIRKNAHALAFIPEEQKTYELCVEALLNGAYDCYVLKYVPDKFKNEKFLLNCVH
jgi:hypothetical protein